MANSPSGEAEIEAALGIDVASSLGMGAGPEAPSASPTTIYPLCSLTDQDISSDWSVLPAFCYQVYRRSDECHWRGWLQSAAARVAVQMHKARLWWHLEGGAVSTHATTSFSPSRSARSQGERLRPSAVFEP